MVRKATASYDHLAAFALEHPWAITPNMLSVIAGIIASRIAGEPPDTAALALAQEMRAAREVPVASGGSVRVIPLHGVIAPRMNLMSEMSGGTTFESLTALLHQAEADPNVKSIVFDVDSPGGNTAGATEFAREVLRVRTVKPIFAHAHPLMASAAYHPMACATEIVASPSALVGGIGVFSMYDDLTDALAQLGIKREVIRAGKFKAEGVGGTGLTDDARAHFQHLIDGAYGRMVGDIAKGRGVTAAAVRSGYGEGRAIDADDAKACGLIDRIGSLQDTIERAMRARPPAASARAEDPPPAATDQEPPARAATSQEPRAVPPDTSTTALLDFEHRLLGLRLKGLA